MEAVFANFGINAEVSQELPMITGQGTLLALGEDLEPVRPRAGLAFGRRYLVNVTPVLTRKEKEDLKAQLSEQERKGLPPPGSIKPFDIIEKQSTGVARLGVLRMDMDNLGDLFTSGLGDKASLARLAALSFAIHLFFDGWVGRLTEARNQEDPRGERLYSIYSGGDDLFFVGSWDAIVELGIHIRADLSEYAASHPGIHASAGVVLVGGKYPLSQAAQDAGGAEAAAKGMEWIDINNNLRRKDAVTFMGKTLPWERFGITECNTESKRTVHGLMHHLHKMVAEKGANKQLLSLLSDLQRQYDSAIEKRRQLGRGFNRTGVQQFPWGPWMWLGAYYLARMQRQAKDEVLKGEIKKLQEELKANFQNIEWIGFAARWAELLSRLREHQNK
jgi:CRISPR-associated protein Csm1